MFVAGLRPENPSQEGPDTLYILEVSAFNIHSRNLTYWALGPSVLGASEGRHRILLRSECPTRTDGSPGVRTSNSLSWLPWNPRTGGLHFGPTCRPKPQPVFLPVVLSMAAIPGVRKPSCVFVSSDSEALHRNYREPAKDGVGSQRYYTASFLIPCGLVTARSGTQAQR